MTNHGGGDGREKSASETAGPFSTGWSAPIAAETPGTPMPVDDAQGAPESVARDSRYTAEIDDTPALERPKKSFERSLQTSRDAATRRFTAEKISGADVTIAK